MDSRAKRRAHATIAAVARFYAVERERVERWIARDGLPVMRLKGQRGMVRKVFVPALHRWHTERSEGVTVGLDVFREEFWRAQEKEKERGAV